MDEINIVTLNALDRYFKVLEVVGFKDYKSVYKLIVLIMISRILNSRCLNRFINEKDYNSIVKALYCLTDCLIDLPKFKTYSDSIYCKNYPIDTQFRVDDEIRLRGIENKLRTI